MLLQVLLGLATTLLQVTAKSSNIILTDLKQNNDPLLSYNESQVWPSKSRCNRRVCAIFSLQNPCCVGNPRPPIVDPIPPWTYPPPRPPPIDPTPPWTYPPPRPPPIDPTPPWIYPPPRPPPIDPTPPWTYPPPRPPPIDPTPPWTYPPPRPPPVDPTPPWTYPPPRPPPIDPTPPWTYPPPRPPPVDPTPPWTYPPPRPPPIDPIPPWTYPPTPPPCLPIYPTCRPTYPTPPTYPPTYYPTPWPTNPPTYYPTYPPTPPPTYPPPNPCCNACSQPPTICPYGYGKRRRRDNRLTKRQCHLDTQCPDKFSCCNGGCMGKVCKRSHFNNSTAPVEIAKLDSSTKFENIITPVNNTTSNKKGSMKKKSSTKKKKTEKTKKKKFKIRNDTIPSDNSVTFQQPKVNITIIFTSASQEASSFLKDYLVPFIYSLSDYTNLQLVPYGKVKENGECEYGYGDCLGNWMIACAARFLPGQYSILSFATCLMSDNNHMNLVQGNYSDIVNAAKECAKDFPDKIRGIYECGVGVQGFRYFMESAWHQYELDHSITDIPTVALDGHIVIRRSSEVGLFPKLICEKLKEYPEVRSWCDQVYPMLNKTENGKKKS